MIVENWVMAEISIVPLGTPSPSLSKYVSACVSILEKYPDLKFELTDMGTIIEGPLERVLTVVAEMHGIPFSIGVSRVLTSVKIDQRKDKKVKIGGKVESVKKRIGSKRLTSRT